MAMSKSRISGQATLRRAVSVAASVVLASALAVPNALAVEEADDALVAVVQTQSASAWGAPTEPVSADDGVVTVGSHLSATATAEVLGLNGTVFPGQSSLGINPASLEEALSTNRLGVYGSDANKVPNPYLRNLFYNYYAEANGLEPAADAAVVDTNNKSRAYLYYIEENEQYGIADDVALRPDIVMGVSGAPGQGYSLRMNQTTTTAVNHTTWGTGLSSPSQPYQSVLQLRRLTDNAELEGASNSDGNPYLVSPHYRAGDESYDPVAVVYDRGTGSSGLDCQVENANNLAWAAQLVLQQNESKTTRYGDPMACANDFERFVKALKWAVLQKIEDGTVKKKTVALVAKVSDGTFTLAKMNPDEDASDNYRIVEAAQDTVNDLADVYFPTAKAGVMRTAITAEQLMAADVVICMPPIAPSYKSSAADVREALSAAGYDESSDGFPALFDNVVPTGTFATVDGLNDSVEAGLLVGLVQGYLYPEVVSPVDAVTYFASRLFHLGDGSLEAFVRAQLDGVSLPPNTALDVAGYDAAAVARVQAVINAGVSYYYEQGAKEAIDAARPRIASTDALDDAYGYGVHDVIVTVPQGATFTLVDDHRLNVTPNENGTYTLDDDDATTLTVQLAGYRDYTVSVTGAEGAVNVALADLTAVKTVSFELPESATVTWVKDAEGRTVKANADGTYTLSKGAIATYSVSMEGFDPYVGVIEVGQEAVVVQVSDFTPESTATQINVPAGAKLTVTDADGVAIQAQPNGTYKLYNGYTYTLAVKHPLYEPFSKTAVGGQNAKITIRLAEMTPSANPVLTIDAETVTAAIVAEEGGAYVSDIVLGPSVKAVASGAFASCANLNNLTFGQNVQSIGASAFAGLTGLSKVTLNHGLKSIGASAFAGCKSLSSIWVPSSVTTVGASAFRGCTKLETATFGDGAATLGASAFEGCTNLSSIMLSSGLTSVGASAFAGCTKLSSVKLPSKVKTLGDKAFAKCTKLSTVSMNKKLATIGKQAFEGCSNLASLTIPEGVTTIGKQAFAGCAKLKKLTVKTKKLKKAKVKGSLTSSKVKTIRVNVGKAKDNRAYVKKYRKIFTKKICGVKVTVRK